MTTVTLTCPACHFSRNVARNRIPESTRQVTCPVCKHRFIFAAPQATTNAAESCTGTRPCPCPSPAGSGDLRQPKNLLFALLFLLLFAALLGGRLYASRRALDTPAPNFITASEAGIATLWKDEVLVTDHVGRLLRRIALPDDVLPTQMIWSGNELWIADYRTKGILILDEQGQRRFPLNGPQLAAHFKIVPDPAHGRIYVSNGAGHTMHLYDQQGNFLRAFGSEGRDPGRLKFPNQFLREASGNLLIANTKSPAIDRYSPEGTFLARVVNPTGHATYKYPTNVAIAPERIVTLEADGFLEDGRIALYDGQGAYLGEHEAVPDFKLIGDIAVWEDRLFATDLAHARVYAFALSDLHFLGEYSPELARLGADFEQEQRNWERLATFALWGMLALFVPVLFFYLRFRKEQAAMTSGNGAAEHLAVNRKDRLERIDLAALPPLEFIAIPTRPANDLLAALLLGVPFFVIIALRLFAPAWPQVQVLGLLLLAMALLAAGAWLSLASSWGCPVSLNKARNFLGKLLRNQGLGLLAGVEQVGIGHCPDKTTLLLLMAPDRLLIAEFDLLGRLNSLCRIPYSALVVEEQKFLMPAFVLGFAGKRKILSATDKPFMTLLRATLESYRLHPERSDHVLRNQPHALHRPLRTAPPPRPAATTKSLQHKAALLSALFPGLGQFYKRHIFKGALFMALFAPIALNLAVNLEPIMDGSIDWAPQSLFGLGTVLYAGLTIFVVNIWDALKN